VLKRFLDDGPPGTPDGVTPFFVEAGAAPTAGNAPYPPGSIVRFGTTYYLQSGTLAVPVWTSLATLITPSVLALLSTGILKVTTGTGALSTAAAGVDYSKGPWKLFSTVRSVAAAQTFSIPIVDGEGNGIVRATGRVLSAGVDWGVTLKVNGSASNVTQQQGSALGSTASAGTTIVAQLGTYGFVFDLVALTAHTANGLQRIIMLRTMDIEAGGTRVVCAATRFNDTTTAITTLDFDSAHANAIAANSEAIVEEGIIS
jgi:hypothetical protein